MSSTGENRTDYPSRTIIIACKQSVANRRDQRAFTGITGHRGRGVNRGRMLIQSPGKRADNDVGGRHYTRVTGAEICGACFINGASTASTGVANVACVRPVE